MIVNWDGKNLPDGLRVLPPGTYLVEPAEAPLLTPAEEDGLRAALRSADAGSMVDSLEVRSRVQAAAHR